MAVTKVTTKVLADDAVTIDKIADAALVTESEGISSNDNDTTIPTSAAVKDYVDTQDATKEDTITGAATTITSSDLTASKVLISNGSGKVAISSFMDTDETNNILDITGKVYFANVFSLESDLPSATTYHGMFAHVHGTGYAYYAHAGNWVKLAKYSELSDTTYTISAVDSGDNAIIRLTDSSSGTDDIILEAGNNITLTPSGDTITIASTASGSVSDAFKTISVSGQSDVVADSATDTLTLAAGSNITLTTDAATDTITIASTASGGDGGSVSVVTTQHTGDGSTQGFALDSTPGDNDAVQVYLNGVYQIKDAANYSISGSTLTFVDAPVTGTDIEFVHFVLTSGGGGGISWDTTVKTADFTATAGEGYFVNTTSAAITVTLPGSPTAGDEVSIVDYAGTADTNNITITSSDNINGSSNNVKIDYERGGVSMVYVDATQGWIAYNAANETDTALALELPPLDVDYLVVAGAGGGGGHLGGGGGAGGLRTSYGSTTGGGGSAESSLSLATATNYTVTVGSGGAGAITTGHASAGNNSIFSTITSTGGGAGVTSSNADTSTNDGGSGGGGGGFNSGTPNNNGSAVTSPATQGYNGGLGSSANQASESGGGGGANAVGGNATSSAAGDGGVGLAVNILNSTNAGAASVGEVSGSDVYYAGGGGGGVDGRNGGTAGSGGIGGGGDGIKSLTLNGENGTANTGGGAGGGSGGNQGIDSDGGTGGSGVVILRYPSEYSITETTSPTVLTFNTYTEGSYKVTVFTSGESGTIEFTTA